MNECLIQFIRDRHIDSFQKVWFLLFLYQKAEKAGTPQEYARHLNFGDAPMLEEIIDELETTGLVQQKDDRYRLYEASEIRAGLARLAAAFEDPLDRQALLKQIYHGGPLANTTAHTAIAA